jgi:arylsulfatase A-like enzyme
MFKLINKFPFCSGVFSVLSLVVSAKEPVKQPNLLFVFPDQFRAQGMGFTKEDPVKTPNIDKLASQGVVFTNAVSNRPVCTPYRGMLMTGKYCFSTNLQTNCNTHSRKYQNFLREDETCFSDILKAGGYYCGYIGKWHLDAPKGPDADDWQNSIWDTYTPPGRKRHGFDFWHAYGCYGDHLNPHYWVNDSPAEDTLFAGKWSPEHEANVAIRFIEANTDKPWALFISMNPPHPPYDQVPDKYKSLYQDIPVEKLLNRPNVPKDQKGDVARKSVADYFAAISGVDEQFGRILEALEASGQAKNTIVIFTSDHGETMGSHGLMQKTVWYEESFRIPLIIRWPTKLKPGTKNVHVSVPDMMPSLLSLMGLKDRIPPQVEGENLADCFLGEKAEGPGFTLYLLCQPESSLGGMRGLRNDRYTFVIQRDNEGKETGLLLFDNKADPFQLKNIANEQPRLVDQFKRQVFEKIKTINDPWIVYGN